MPAHLKIMEEGMLGVRKVDQDKIITLDEKNISPMVQIGMSLVIGTRTEQQDSILGFSSGSYHIAAVCDGMGGLRGGGHASQTAVKLLKEDVAILDENTELSDFLKKEALKIDKEIYSLYDEEGEPLNAGSTIVAVLIHKNKLFWMSVGDSRIYYIQKGSIFQVTREHNYQLSLDILKKRGQISEQDYETEVERGDALISYLGMGNLRLIDGNTSAVTLNRGDTFLLCSDGLYKSMPEEQILRIVQRCKNLQDAADALTSYITENMKDSQDNASAVLISFG